MILGLVGKVLLKTIIKKQVLETIFENHYWYFTE